MRRRSHGRELWALTPAGREQLLVALHAGAVEDLPESPQHRAWREARACASERLEPLRAGLEAAIGRLQGLIEAAPPAPAATWRVAARSLAEAIEQLALAVEYLHEWPEPDDHDADLDPSTGRPRRWGVHRLKDGDDER